MSADRRVAGAAGRPDGCVARRSGARSVAAPVCRTRPAPRPARAPQAGPAARTAGRRWRRALVGSRRGRRGSRSRQGGQTTLCAGPTVASAANTGSTRILLVDDEQSVQTLLTYPLHQGGLRGGRRPTTGARLSIDSPSSASTWSCWTSCCRPLDGIEVCRRIRSRSQVPIIMLTAKDDEIDKVLGLEMGADDYITKPFSVREFRSRVRAALRRTEMLARRPGGDGADRDRRPEDRLRAPGGDHARTRGLRLTYVEFEVLAALARSPGRVHTREMLLEQVWGDSAYRDSRTIDVHIRHLREKLERDPAPPSTCSRCAGSAIGSATKRNRRSAVGSVRNRLAAVLRDHGRRDRVRLPVRRPQLARASPREARAARAGRHRQSQPLAPPSHRASARSAGWCAEPRRPTPRDPAGARARRARGAAGGRPAPAQGARRASRSRSAASAAGRLGRRAGRGSHREAAMPLSVGGGSAGSRASRRSPTSTTPSR